MDLSASAAQDVSDDDTETAGLVVPRVLKVTEDMLSALEITLTAMLERVPKVRFTVPLQDHIGETIFETILLKSAMEKPPESPETALQTDARHENWNHRYVNLMDSYNKLKIKVNDACTPPIRSLKRKATDDGPKNSEETQQDETQCSQPEFTNDFEDTQSEFANTFEDTMPNPFENIQGLL